MSSVSQQSGRPVAPAAGRLRPLGTAEVRIAGGFWADRQSVNGDKTLDHCRQWMDRLGWTGNFAAAATPDGATRARRGREFTDSEVYKLIEAMAWEYGRTAEPDLPAAIKELAVAIESAQAADGYLNTAFGRDHQAARYSDVAFGHELYCTGHLLQAAVACARTGAGDAIVEIARRAADHVCATFGATGLPEVCGHPEIEMALVEFSRVTGDRRYAEQAALFVERRGHRTLREQEVGYAYFLDDVPIRDADVLRGHAVRALYLSCGAVDVAVETGDAELLAAVRRQFARTLSRRTYLTGGMGSRHLDEAFGDDFVLPADRAYSETCAAVASVMLAWRLLLATGDTSYADVIERTLFNVIATSPSDSGDAFFYANTLHQRTAAEEFPPDEQVLRFGGGLRAPWFEVSCCLPNVARLVASLGCYAATSDDAGLQIHQYADMDVRTTLAGGAHIGVDVRTGYPDSGGISVRVTASRAEPWTITLRVPSWASGAVLDGPTGRYEAQPGTVSVTHAFAAGDELRLELPMAPRWTAADPRIDAVRGCVAVERGPLVLCAEATPDDKLDLDGVEVALDVPPADAPGGASGGAAVRAWQLPDGSAAWISGADPGWPYAAAGDTERAARVPADAFDLDLIPYHRWGRRGPSTMRVWLPARSPDNS